MEPAPRNQYIDSLRALAILRVVVYHLMGWAWLSYVFPAMGVMFAVAGSLMAASLSRGSARKVVTSRVRRLLPALWVLGLIAVPTMLVHGWHHSDPENPLHWHKLLYWIVPLDNPPGSAWGEPFWEVLWYVRAYLLFVVLSPLLWVLYRWYGWLTVVAPLVGVLALELSGFSLRGDLDAIMWDFATYGACWMAGFLHRDRTLAKLPVVAWLTLVGFFGAAGTIWLLRHSATDGLDINGVPVARALWSFAFALFVLRFEPSMAWLRRVPVAFSAVKLVNARAVTIYLWHYPLISVAVLVTEELLRVAWGTPGYFPVAFGVELVLVLVAVLALGWVEDVAARRKPALWPVGRRRRDAAPAPDAALSPAALSPDALSPDALSPDALSPGAPSADAAPAPDGAFRGPARADAETAVPALRPAAPALE